VKPTPIPDAEVWAGAERVLYGPPPGQGVDIATVEALEDHSERTGLVRVSVRLEVEPGDVGKLRQPGGAVWLTFYGGMVPWSVDVERPW